LSETAASPTTRRRTVLPLATFSTALRCTCGPRIRASISTRTCRSSLRGSCRRRYSRSARGTELANVGDSLPALDGRVLEGGI
jgi:hypothetical protein